MEEHGLMPVANPSSLLLAERPQGVAGSVVLACMEGVRPLLIEVQALVSTTCFGMPRRTAAGIDYNRLILLLAVLEKRCGLLLGNQDAYVNAVGGIKIDEPAADLAVCLALASSFRSRPVEPYTAVMGEVGLTGEVRMVGRADLRVREAAAMGFKRVVIPASSVAGLKIGRTDIIVKGVSNIEEAMEVAFHD
jgi:DNA repair protein RadA/Sms